MNNHHRTTDDDDDDDDQEWETHAHQSGSFYAHGHGQMSARNVIIG